MRLSGTDGAETARTRLDWTDPCPLSQPRVLSQQSVLLQQPILVHRGRICMLHSKLPLYAPLEMLVHRSADLGVIRPAKIALEGAVAGRRCCDVDMCSGFVAIGDELFLWDNHSHSKSVLRETVRVFSLDGEPLRVLQLPQSSPSIARKLVGSTGGFLVLHNVRNEETDGVHQLSHKRTILEVWSVHGSLLMASPEEVWPSKHLTHISCDDDRLVVVRNSASSVSAVTGLLTGFVC